MHKILIKGYFKNCSINEKLEYNNYGFLVGNVINFKHENTNLKIIVKNNKIVFTKEDNNSKLVQEFILNEITNGIYSLKNDNLNLNISIHTTLLEKSDNSFKVEYDLLDNINKEKNILYIEYEVQK